MKKCDCTLLSLCAPRVHVSSGNGEAKFWIEPVIELAQNCGLNTMELGAVKELVEDHEVEIRNAWKRHFGR